MQKKLNKIAKDTNSFLKKFIKRQKKSATIADFDAVKILKIVDFPTLGRPTIATTDMTN